MPGAADMFATWLGALEQRHLADLTIPEIRRAVQALSAIYVERRDKLSTGAPLETAGKRAAFALFYGPLHFLTVREIVRALGAARPGPVSILDLGCGTGAAGAAWALEARGRPSTVGIDVNRWAVDETWWTLGTLGVRGKALRGDAARFRLPGRRAGIVAAFTVNELTAASRDALLGRLMEAAEGGASILVVEPVARRPLPWWRAWAEAFTESGGRDDSWAFPVELPEPLALLDRAAGLDHRVLKARSLWLPNPPSKAPELS